MLDSETDRQTDTVPSLQKFTCQVPGHLLMYWEDTGSHSLPAPEEQPQMEWALLPRPPEAQTPGMVLPSSEADADAADRAAPGRQSLEALQEDRV